MASQAAPRLATAFQNAKQDFLASLKDTDLLKSVSNIKSIDEVYAFTTQLQNDQGKRQGLRNLSKIKPYLDRLKEYAGVIEVFVQAKPNILALIWGPIKLLLQMADNLTQSFDAIVEAMAGIGNRLPLFESYINIFETSDRVLNVLVLFYKDILDFYEIMLKFFSAKRWVIIFDSVWPRYKSKINLVVNSIERHSVLMTEEVTLANINEAHMARVADRDNWQRTFEFQETQDFNSVYSYISPKLYDDELDRLQRSVCERTGKWLQKEEALKEWIDASNAAPRILWIQGIPGAGKTYIASMLVEELRQSSKTVLFAFLSYTKSDMTPISVIHSLMFQLATGEDHFDDLLKRDLRAKISNIFRSSQRNLKSNTQFARETLTELLKCVGTAYIILDGLDEVSKNEHMVDILNELLKVLDGCTGVKLLISSRAQDEIDSALNKVSVKRIRVNEKNSGCIHAYVTVTTNEWLSRAGFEQKDCDEIRVLLKPLSTKSRGMFLYARVVMANVVDMYTLDMVKDELKVLPENLDEAYSRVLDRLNSLAPPRGKLCRRALGWIGCAPVSITVEELSFALNLNSDGRRDIPKSESIMNVVRLCGPIVEIINGHVNFVHFTVKEYLFEREGAFLNALEPTIEMTEACLHYLSSDIFDIEIEPKMIDSNILSGLYRLHWFATTQWIVLLQKCESLLGGCDFPDSLILALKRFAHECENGSFKGTADLTNQPDFSALKQKEPALRELLVQELYFRRMDVGNWKLAGNNEEDGSWPNLDPFYLSFIAMLIHESFEALLCPTRLHKASCNCTRLKKLYGERLFRCHYSICQPFQMPFASRAARDAHCRDHTRVHKCPHPSCDFSTLGFSSASQLGKHKSICHVNAPLKAIQTMKTPERDEIVPLISDIITMGMTDELKALLPRFYMISPHMLKALVSESAFCGKLEIFQHLWEQYNIKFDVRQSLDFITSCACDSIRGDNVEVLEYLVPMITPRGAAHRGLLNYMQCGANSESPRIFEIWKKQAGECNASHLIRKGLLGFLADPDKQERFATILDERASRGHLASSQLGTGLKNIASTSCAPSIARVLLKHGAAVDFKPEPAKRNIFMKTPLLAAAGRDSKDAAELMKLLLLAGADPNAYYYVKEGSEPQFVSMERGAKGISKWLPFSWAELVEWAAAERTKNVINVDGLSVLRPSPTT